MSTHLVWLALLMWAATYPSRAVPLLAPGVERLPGAALTYLRLVGPAILLSLAAVNTLVVTGADGARRLSVGIALVSVAACIGLVAWRRNLLLGLVVAVAIAALYRAL